MPQEHVPLGAYGLLRRIVGLGPQRVRRERVWEDAPARYLVLRRLARESEPGGSYIENTEAGRLVGLIDVEAEQPTTRSVPSLTTSLHTDERHS